MLEQITDYSLAAESAADLKNNGDTNSERRFPWHSKYADLVINLPFSK